MTSMRQLLKQDPGLLSIWQRVEKINKRKIAFKYFFFLVEMMINRDKTSDSTNSGRHHFAIVFVIKIK